MKEEIKQEIIKRMKILKLNNQIIEDFKSNNNLYICNIETNITERVPKEKEYLVQKLEKRYNNVKVYYIIKNKNIVYFVYLQNNHEEWKRQKQDLRAGYVETIQITIKDGIIGVLLDEVSSKITRIISIK